MAEHTNRVAVVSGGGRGIGRGISLALADDGCDVAVNYRRDRESAEKTVQDIELRGRRGIAVQASVDDWGATAAMVDDVASQLGAPSILVHSGGIASRGNTVADTEVAEMERVVRTHAFGGFHLAKASIPHLVTHDRSDIVMISSVVTDSFSARTSPYGMGKAALEAVAMTLAKELQSEGVRVNVVAPGLVTTAMGDRIAKAMTGGAAGEAADLDAKAAFGHVCRPEDVASVVRFLVSDAGSYLSGIRVRVDGGGADFA